MNLDNKVILITGGTGSFGKALSAYLLKTSKPKKIIIFSRDEFLQYEMSKKEIYKKNIEIMRYFIGDVRDYKRLEYAIHEVDGTFAFNGKGVVVDCRSLTTGEYYVLKYDNKEQRFFKKAGEIDATKGK